MENGCPPSSQLNLHFAFFLQLLVKVAGGTGDENPSRNSALAVFNPLNNPGCLTAFRTIRALRLVHNFLAVGFFRNLRHGESLLFPLFGPKIWSEPMKGIGGQE